MSEHQVCLRYGCVKRSLLSQDERCVDWGFPTQVTTESELTARAEAIEASMLEEPEVIAPPSSIIVTNNELPGHDIVKVYGDVFRLTVRARNVMSITAAKPRTLTGGEVGGYTKLLTTAGTRRGLG